MKGKVELIIDGETKTLSIGDGYFIPSNVNHGFNVIDEEGVEYVEIFSSPKEENR